MEEVVNVIGDLEEGRGEDDSVGSDTIVAYGQGGDEREIGRFDQGGVALELDDLSRANQDGSEFQQGELLANLVARCVGYRDLASIYANRLGMEV